MTLCEQSNQFTGEELRAMAAAIDEQDVVASRFCGLAGARADSEELRTRARQGFGVVPS